MSALSDGFDQPQEITPIMQAFPASVVGTLLPEWDAIPEEFRGHRGTMWNRFVSRLFVFGGDAFEKFNLYERPDVDGQLAFAHLSTILRSYEPKHEHKIAGVAWLASRWYDRIEERIPA